MINRAAFNQQFPLTPSDFQFTPGINPTAQPPGMYTPPIDTGSTGEGFLSKAKNWLGQPAHGSPNQGLLDATGGPSQVPRQNRLSMIGDLLMGAGQGYMAGLKSGIQGDWGSAIVGGVNAMKASQQEEYERQRQEITDRIAILNANKNTNKSRVVPPGAVVLDADGNVQYSNPKSEKEHVPTGDAALVAALTDPNVPPEQKAIWQKILDDKTRPPQPPQPRQEPQDPEIVRTARILFPGNEDEQRKWIMDQKEKTDWKMVQQPDGTFTAVPIRNSPDAPKPVDAGTPKPRVLTPTEEKMKADAEDQILQGKTSLSSLQRLLDLNDDVPDGPGADITMHTLALTNPEKYAKAQEFNTLAKQQVLNVLKATFGGQPTEGERQILIEVEGSMNKPRAVRQAIYKRAMDIANQRQAKNFQRHKEISEGSFGAVQTPTTRKFNPATGRLE